MVGTSAYHVPHLLPTVQTKDRKGAYLPKYNSPAAQLRGVTSYLFGPNDEHGPPEHSANGQIATFDNTYQVLILCEKSEKPDSLN